jgi:hypothetical protein
MSNKKNYIPSTYMVKPHKIQLILKISLNTTILRATIIEK